MRSRKFVSAIMTFGVASAMLTLSATSAQAANTCNHWKTTTVRTALPDLYGVGARCSDLNVNNKARGGLDVTADIDVYTQYFTAKNVSYYSSSKRALVGGTYVEIRTV